MWPSKTGLLTFLASSVIGVPQPVPDSHEIEIVKRGTPLSLRDIELAEVHGVNTTEMFKHSVIKRNDGDHLTVWVHTSFEEPDNPGVESDKRSVKVLETLHSTSNADRCGHSNIEPDNGPHAPFVGGVTMIQDWAASRKGYFIFRHQNTAWTSLVVAGSNSGSNAHFRGRNVYSVRTWVGTSDIHNLCRDSIKEHKQSFDGRWRVRTHGRMRCESMDPTCDLQICGIYPQNSYMDWQIGWHIGSV